MPSANRKLGAAAAAFQRAKTAVNSLPKRSFKDRPDKMYDRLATAGLVPSRAPTTTTLATLLKLFFDHLTVKPGTRVTYSQTRTSLEEHFGGERLITSIGPLEAESFAQALRGRTAAATASKRIKTARQIFRCAVKWKLIGENPFIEVRAGAQVNRARSAFVSRADIAKVMDQCPDAEWRLLLALARYGGLRCTSEVFSLRWQDVDWNKGCLRITSPKTEHLDGGGERDCPIFPELRPFLLEAFEIASPGAEWVITRYRDLNSNLRTQLQRMIARAGVKQWPRLFHNLRASRQTELEAEFPLADVCAWLGNSPAIAAPHYLQARDSSFEAATQRSTCDAPVSDQRTRVHAHAPTRTAQTPDTNEQKHPLQRGTDSGTLKAQIAAQHAEAGDRTGGQFGTQIPVPQRVMQMEKRPAKPCEASK